MIRERPVARDYGIAGDAAGGDEKSADEWVCGLECV